MHKLTCFKILISISWLLSPGAMAEEVPTLHFVVYVGSDKAGTLSISKNVEGEKVSYHLHSEVHVNLLVGIAVVEDIQDVFVKGFLQTSEHTRFVNRTQRIKNSVSYANQQYRLSTNDKHQGFITSAIRASITSLYFVEPVLLTPVYSPSFQQLLLLKRITPHGYLLKLPNGSTAEYQYEKGELKRVLASNAWGEVRFERTK